MINMKSIAATVPMNSCIVIHRTERIMTVAIVLRALSPVASVTVLAVHVASKCDSGFESI